MKKYCIVCMANLLYCSPPWTQNKKNQVFWIWTGVKILSIFSAEIAHKPRKGMNKKFANRTKFELKIQAIRIFKTKVTFLKHRKHQKKMYLSIRILIFFFFVSFSLSFQWNKNGISVLIDWPTKSECLF